jgi:general secretion pathway protein J
MIRALFLRSRSRSQAGFTLLELLVAIAILATVSIIAWRGLDTLVTTRARLEPEGDRVRALLTVFGQLDRDLSQTINPTFFFAPTTPPVTPVTIVTIGGQPALSIMRLAPGEADAPSALQVIGYRIEDGFLVRSSSLPMRGRGAVAAEEITNVRLLGGIKSLRVRVWSDQQGNWVDPLATQTPVAVPTVPGQVAPSLIPPGIEISVERNDGTVFRKVLLVG